MSTTEIFPISWGGLNKGFYGIRVKSDKKYKTKNVNKLKVAFKRLASRKIDVDLSPVWKTKNHSRSDPLNKLDKCILPSNPFILSRRPISKITKAQKEIINHKIHNRAQSTNDSVQNIGHSNTIKQRKPNIPHPSESRNSLDLYSQVSYTVNPFSSTPKRPRSVQFWEGTGQRLLVF